MMNLFDISDSGLNHILIDEFQDTSVAQFSLIEKLTEEWHFYNNSNIDKNFIYCWRSHAVNLFI